MEIEQRDVMQQRGKKIRSYHQQRQTEAQTALGKSIQGNNTGRQNGVDRLRRLL